MQQSAGSKWVQVGRKMQKAFKNCAFTAVQGKGLFILQEIQHMQMSLFPYFFFSQNNIHIRKMIQENFRFMSLQKCPRSMP